MIAIQITQITNGWLVQKAGTSPENPPQSIYCIDVEDVIDCIGKLLPSDKPTLTVIK